MDGIVNWRTVGWLLGGVTGLQQLRGFNRSAVNSGVKQDCSNSRGCNRTAVNVGDVTGLQ